MRPCGPDPEMRERAMPRAPAKRRASGVVKAPPDVLAGPKLRSGLRTSRQGSIGMARGVGAVCATWIGAAAFRGAGAAFGAEAGAALAASPAPESTATTAPTFAT